MAGYKSKIRFGADYYRSSRFVGIRPADPKNSFNLDAYHKLYMHLGLAIADREVYFWVDNLLNKRFDYYGYYFEGCAVGTPSRGRTIGLGMATYF